MRDVYAIFGTLLALGIAFPGWLFAWWLLFPNRVEQAGQQISEHTRRSFIWGIVGTVVIALPALILANIPLPFAQLVGVTIGLLAFAIAALGASGIVLHMAQRLRAHSQSDLSQSAAFFRAAIAFELSAAFPFIGWFLILPACFILSLGAALQSIRNRPEPVPQPTMQPPLRVEVS